MRQERLCGCDPTLGSGLSPELSGVPVGANQSLLKGVGCGGNFSQVEGGSSETRAVPQPSVSSKSSKASPACHTAWPEQELSVLGTAGTRGTKPRPCRDTAVGATQGMCVSLAHAPELFLLLPSSGSCRAAGHSAGRSHLVSLAEPCLSLTAIQLLRDKEPGTFLVRDSTSYRGSFGLAMKVPGSPSSSQTGMGVQTGRCFKGLTGTTQTKAS